MLLDDGWIRLIEVWMGAPNLKRTLDISPRCTSAYQKKVLKIGNREPHAPLLLFCLVLPVFHFTHRLHMPMPALCGAFAECEKVHNVF